MEIFSALKSGLQYLGFFASQAADEMSFDLNATTDLNLSPEIFADRERKWNWGANEAI